MQAKIELLFRHKPNTIAMSDAEENKRKMIEILEEELPEFVKLVQSSTEEVIVLHQDAFAADYEEDECFLLGMAVKYAGLHNREITIIPEKQQR